MNILIVDDITDNREILERLLRQFSRKHEVTIEVFHAENGEIAVQTCEEYPIDLVFMDIFMPVMNGLEATKIIKKSRPSVMIIVISSEEDEEIKQDILHAGAEDYISKPFSSAIMLSRLNNYHRLVLSRNSIGYQTRAVNIFTHNVYSYQMKFFISNDDELSQFWETMMVRLEFHNHIDHLCDFVRFIFRLSTYQLQKSYKCHVYLEEDEHHFYFTMDNMRLLCTETIHKMIKKYYIEAVYEIEGNLLSFVLTKTGSDLVNAGSTITEAAVSASLSTPMHAEPLPVPIKKEPALQTYDILDADAIEEFEHVVSKLQTEISLMGSSSLNIDDIDTMNIYIKQLAAILSISQDAYVIAESLRSFSILLDEYSEPFLAMSKELSTMVTSFINDIVMWKDMVFYSGAPSVDFLNSSISSNVQMIRAIFVIDNTAEEDLDDIFDF